MSDVPGGPDDLEGRIAGRRSGLRRSLRARVKTIASAIFVLSCTFGAVAVNSGHSTPSSPSNLNWGAGATAFAATWLFGLFLLVVTVIVNHRQQDRVRADVTRRGQNLAVRPEPRTDEFFARGRLSSRGDWPSLAGEETVNPNEPPATSE